MIPAALQIVVDLVLLVFIPIYLWHCRDMWTEPLQDGFLNMGLSPLTMTRIRFILMVLVSFFFMLVLVNHLLQVARA